MILAFNQIPRALGMAALLILTAVAAHAQACTVQTPCIAPPGVVGQPYSVIFYATGGFPPYSNFSITSGSLPPGLSLTGSSSGIITISGIPTTAVGSPFVFVVTFIDSQNDPVTPGEVSITITGAPGPPSLTAAPSFLSFATEAGSSATLQQSLLVQDAGGGSVAFTASVAGGSPWVTISPTSGTATAGAPVEVTVTANAQALKVSSNHDAIQLASSAGNVNIPVTLFASGSGPILGVGASGVLFSMVQGSVSSLSQTVPIVNTGSSTSTVNWSVATAPISTGSHFIDFGSLSGQASASSPGALVLSLDPSAATLGPGAFYQLIDVSDNNSLNSPQFITAVLNVVASTGDPAPPPPPAPVMVPGGLVFIGSVGQPMPAQQFMANVSTAQFQDYSTSPSLPAGQNWLSLSPPSGSANLNNPALITAKVKTTGLGQGIYKGLAEVGFNQGTFSVNVTMILTGAAGATPASTGARAAAHPADHPAAANANGCTPANLILTETGLDNSFSVPAGWPSNLIVGLNDDCGDNVGSGSVSASFSNGDPPLTLVTQGQTGQYSATWQPQNSGANTIVTLLATANGLNSATAQIAGSVAANTAPVLSPHGIVNTWNPVLGGALAPGTAAEVFGSNLAAFTGSTTGSPLPTAFQGSQLVVGGRLAPLYYLSNGQVNAQIPFELTPGQGQQFAAVAAVNGALTLPILIDVVPLVPGVLENPDGSLVAQRSADGSFVSATNPTFPGDDLVMYVLGMGATNPPVLSGVPAPSSPLANAVVQPTVTVDNQNAQILYAGLTPTYVGLYQINFVVPATAPAGNLNVVVTQGTATAQTTTLLVAAAP
jgi:uncharacterized protein (TIGR03437 family)